MRVSSTGNWKQSPKAMMNFSVMSSDSFTLPKKVIRTPSTVSGTTALSVGRAPIRLLGRFTGADCSRFAKIELTSAKPRKKAIASGVTTKWAKDAPRRNMKGEATMKGRNAPFSDL